MIKELNQLKQHSKYKMIDLICPNVTNCPAYKAWRIEEKGLSNTIIHGEETGYSCIALTYIQQNKLGGSNVECANLEILNTQSKLLKLLEDKK